MRINKYVALATGMSRRTADAAIESGRVSVNGVTSVAGQEVSQTDNVVIDNKPLTTAIKIVTIMLNKPVGYVVSREGQGSRTIYDLLPEKYHNLKPIGRLDKDSSGLLLLTNDGELAHQLTHPSFQKEKIYEVELDNPLTQQDKAKVEQGVELEDGISRLQVTANRLQIGKPLTPNLPPVTYRVAMHEGRNRQIRRTFAAQGYTVTKLHRTKFGKYSLGDLEIGNFREIL